MDALYLFLNSLNELSMLYILYRMNCKIHEFTYAATSVLSILNASYDLMVYKVGRNLV